MQHLPINMQHCLGVHDAIQPQTVPIYADRNGGTGGASESIGIGAKYGPSKDLLFLHAPPGFCQSLYKPQIEKLLFIGYIE